MKEYDVQKFILGLVFIILSVKILKRTLRLPRPFMDKDSTFGKLVEVFLKERLNPVILKQPPFQFFNLFQLLRIQSVRSLRFRV